MRSFVNEHSVEYLIVPKFAEILAQRYYSIIPLYFWSSREGGNLSIECTGKEKFTIVALYARRPKVKEPNQERVEIKLNHSILRVSDYLREHGISAFAGVPNVSTLLDFQIGAECSWLQLKKESHSDQFAYLDIKSRNIHSDSSSLRCGVSGKQILNIIKNISTPMSWPTAVTIIKEAWMLYDNALFWRFSQYKPVFFLLR